MILVWLIIAPFAGAVLAWLLARWSVALARYVSLAAMACQLALAIDLLLSSSGGTGAETWVVQFSVPWIPQLGIRFELGIDALSLWLIILTGFIGLITVFSSWQNIKERVGLFHLQLLLAIAGITGVFLALDLFLFYVFWELMLIPTYFIIAIWGDQNRGPASIRFFIFTQAGGLLMLVSILAVYFIHGRTTGNYTFSYNEIVQSGISGNTAVWLALGFIAAFLVKMPAVPLHTWLPLAYASAPTGGSILLSALLSKTGAYGLIRFIKPMFPSAVDQIAPYMMALGVAGVLYGAMMAFGQRDLKRLIGYSSISHLSFVLLGVFAGTATALQGAVMQMVAHGLSVAGLFLMAESVQQRLATRELDQTGGLWAIAPRMSAAGMIFGLATLGLPGMGNFIGEFLVLVGSFSVNPLLAAIATIGFVFSVIYAPWMVQSLFQGRLHKQSGVADLNLREVLTSAVLVLAILWLGVYPKPFFDTLSGTISKLQRPTTAVAQQNVSPNIISTQSNSR